MNIYDFIESRSLVDYLKKINYKPDARDASVIVFNSMKTMSEKERAYKEIIETMPDCEYDFCGEKRKIHEDLTCMMKEQKEIADMFYRKDEGASYEVQLSYTDSELSWKYDFSQKKFSDIDTCFAEADKRPKQDMKYIRVVKYFEQIHNFIEIYFTPALEIFEIDRCGDCYPAEGQSIFAYMETEIPFPFKKGDLVRYRYRDFVDNDDRVCVITNIDGKEIEMYSGDYMIVIGNPLYLDSYDGKITDANIRLLKSISAFLTGKLKIGEFLNAYDCCKAEKMFENNLDMLYDDARKIIKYKKRKQSR